MPLSTFKLSAADFIAYGHALQRPECVWTDREGVWTSDARTAFVGSVGLTHLLTFRVLAGL